MSIKFRNLKRTTEGILVHSIQLKRETCKFVTTPSHYRVCVSARTYYLKSRFILRQILFSVVCKAFSLVQIEVSTWLYEFPIAWMEKRDNLSEQSCIFHAWTNTEEILMLKLF